MGSCDASILDEIPNEIARLATCIVKRWWSSHGLPYVIDVFHIEPELRISVVYCSALRLHMLTSIFHVSM
jgi:hypothetical protein